MSDLLEAINEVQDKIGTPFRDPGRDPFSLALSVRDELVLHPDDLKVCPLAFIQAVGNAGITIRECVWMPKGTFLLMGHAATAMQRLKFDRQVAKAMKENEQFLRLMKLNGLA